MENTARNLSRRYLEQLPDRQGALRPSELRSQGWPKPLCDWMETELTDRLEAELPSPDLRWSETTSPQVMKKRQEYVEVVMEMARVPQEDVESFLFEAVSGLMGLLLQPRRRIPRRLFGDESELDRDGLQRRIGRIPVHSHLVQAIVRYMDRRGLEKLGFEQCERVLTQIDDKLSDRYNALQWAEMLDSLFVLVGNEVPPALLRLFFEDKKRHRLARRFELMNQPVTRSLLIEVISSPDLSEDSEGKQPQLFDTPETPEDKVPLHSRFRFDEPKTHSFLNENSRDSGREETPVAQFATHRDDEEETPLTYFSSRGDDMTSPPFFQSTGFESADNEKETPLTQFSAEATETDEVDEEVDEGDDGSIWKRFMKDVEEDEVDDETGAADNTEPEDVRSGRYEEVGSARYPVVEERQKSREMQLQENTPAAPDRENEEKREAPKVHPHPETSVTPGSVAGLEEWLAGNEDRFREELFQGSDRAYRETIRALSEFSEWKEAARYIQNEIFIRRNVDMFEDAAVDFTDRMQEWYSGS